MTFPVYPPSVWWPLTLHVPVGGSTPFEAWLLWHHQFLIPRVIA